MDRVTEELTKKELYRIAKEVKATYVSKATKTMLVTAINERIDMINAKDASLMENPLGANGSEECDSVPVIEGIEPDLIIVDEFTREYLAPQVHRGYHPITGELV